MKGMMITKKALTMEDCGAGTVDRSVFDYVNGPQVNGVDVESVEKDETGRWAEYRVRLAYGGTKLEMTVNENEIRRCETAENAFLMELKVALGAFETYLKRTSATRTETRYGYVLETQYGEEIEKTDYFMTKGQGLRQFRKLVEDDKIIRGRYVRATWKIRETDGKDRFSEYVNFGRREEVVAEFFRYGAASIYDDEDLEDAIVLKEGTSIEYSDLSWEDEKTEKVETTEEKRDETEDAVLESEEVVEEQEEQFVKDETENKKHTWSPVYDDDKIIEAVELLKTHTYAEVTKMTGISGRTLVKYKQLIAPNQKCAEPRRIYNDEQLEEALELLETHTLVEVAKMTGICVETIRRYREKKGLPPMRRGRRTSIPTEERKEEDVVVAESEDGKEVDTMEKHEAVVANEPETELPKSSEQKVRTEKKRKFNSEPPVIDFGDPSPERILKPTYDAAFSDY